MYARASIMLLNLDGSLFLDLSPYAENPVSTHDEHGFAGFNCGISANYRASIDRSWIGKIVEVGTGDTLWWRGRLEDITQDNTKASIACAGTWASTRDTTINRTFVNSKVSDWFILDRTEYSFAWSERFAMSNNNGLTFSSKEGETYGTTDFGIFAFQLPDNDDDAIIEVEFDYEQEATSGEWRIQIQGWATAWSSADAAVWTLNSNGSNQSGSQTVSISSRDTITFIWYKYSGATTETADTGDNYCKITNVIVRCIQDPITAQDVVQTLVASDGTIAVEKGATGLSSGLSAETGFIEDVDSSVDYEHLSFFDTTLQKALQHMALIGASSGTCIEVGVYDESALYFRERCANAVAWYLEPERVHITESLDDVINKVAVQYKDTNNDTVRTSFSSNQQSIDDYGTTKEVIIKSTLADANSATNMRDSMLEQYAVPPVRARVELIDRANTYVSGIRVNDSITVMPSLGSSSSGINEFLVKSLSHDIEQGTISLAAEYDPEHHNSPHATKVEKRWETIANIEPEKNRIIDSR